MPGLNIYLTGVGGQGIGLLSETLLRAIDHSGQNAIGVDTHGLAQRGGIVISHIRVGETIYSPLIPGGEADLSVALECHEALRSLNSALRDRGTLIYYDTVWQPLPVRLNLLNEVCSKDINAACKERDIREVKICYDKLPDPRMQNMALLAAIDHHRLVPGIKTNHFHLAMGDLMKGSMLEKNLKIFDEVQQIL